MEAKKRKEFEELARPLMKWMSENLHPHVHAVIDYSRAEISEGMTAFSTDDYVKD